MSISIKITVPSESEELSQIQKAAFKPLFEKFHDEGNPFLRGSEDILCRLNKFNRYFTILYDGKMVGGIFYRLYGKRDPADEIRAGEYYLARIYIHPEYQNKGIAREAILRCEKEFPDAKFYYVDFPEEMEKNRKCYQSAGYCDIGERVCMQGAPSLAMFKKTVSDVFEPAGVSLPIDMSLSKKGDDVFELHNLAVLLEYRHKGFGKLLLNHAKNVVNSFGRNIIKIGIIEENTVLKNWYIANGFVHTGTKKFEHLPFTSGYLEWRG